MEKVWVKKNVHYIDEATWNQYIVNAPKDSKTWLIDWGSTPYGRSEGDNLLNGRIQRLACIATYLGDQYNVGFGDIRKGENILESYDFDWGQYAYMAPLQMIIKNGIMYQLPQKKSIHVVIYAEMLANLEKAAVYKAPVYSPRNELNIYWEYLLKELRSKNPFRTLDGYLRKKFKLDKKEKYWYSQYFVDPLFRSKSNKDQGKTLLFYFIIPALVLIMFALYHPCKKLHHMPA